MRTEADKAYLAGFIDGEGHIGIGLLANRNGKGRHTLIMTITNRHIQTLRELALIWNGSIVGVRQRAINWSTVGDLRWSTDAVVRVLREVQPYLRIKREQARIALEFAQTIRPREHCTKTITDAEWEYREQLRYQIQMLNSRNPEPPRKMAEQPALTCQYCGATFNTYQKRRKYCSQKCSMDAGRDAYVDRHTYTKVCPGCGESFTARMKQQYCSIKCGRKVQSPPVPKGTKRS